MLAAGADKHAKDVKGLAPLHLAAASGSVGAVDQLLAAGADKEGKDADLASPLHVAAMSGHAAVVGTLLAAGPCFPDSLPSFTCLDVRLPGFTPITFPS